MLSALHHTGALFLSLKMGKGPAQLLAPWFDSGWPDFSCVDLIQPLSTMPDTKTSGAIMHAEYDASCNYLLSTD